MSEFDEVPEGSRDADVDGVWRDEWKRAGEPGELYWDPIQGKMRRKRGRRKRIRRGPYSLEEKNMIGAFQWLLSSVRRMDGELSQYTCIDITTLIVALRRVCEQYSYENTGSDVSSLSRHCVLEAVGFEISLGDVGSLGAEDKDIWEDLRLWVMVWLTRFALAG